MNAKVFITAILVQSIFQISIFAGFAYSQKKEIWGERATPQSQGINEAKMLEALDYLKSKSFQDGIEEVVIVRNGKIIYEGNSVSKKHSIYSCSKVFTSTVLGLLIDENRVKLDDLAAKFEPSLSELYPAFCHDDLGLQRRRPQPLGRRKR
jgi:CubicO group peptidase (beta-lactamase class C family)